MPSLGVFLGAFLGAFLGVLGNLVWSILKTEYYFRLIWPITRLKLV